MVAGALYKQVLPLQELYALVELEHFPDRFGWQRFDPTQSSCAFNISTLFWMHGNPATHHFSGALPTPWSSISAPQHLSICTHPNLALPSTSARRVPLLWQMMALGIKPTCQECQSHCLAERDKVINCPVPDQDQLGVASPSQAPSSRLVSSVQARAAPCC